MKNLYILFTSIFLIFFISCSDDDSSGSTNEDDIVGKWEITEFKVVGTTETDNGTEVQETSTTLENCDPTPTWEFFSNGDFERREFEIIDIDDGSCSVGELVTTDNWERIDNNTIQINEDSNGETLELEVSFIENNQVELFTEQTNGDTLLEYTFSLNRL